MSQRYDAIVIGAGIWSYLLLVLRQSADGKRSMPDLGRVERYSSELLWPGVKAFVVSLLVLIPVQRYADAAAQVKSSVSPLQSIKELAKIIRATN